MVKEKPHNDGQWTRARFNSFIKGGLRSISKRWPPKNQVRKDAWVERGVYWCAGYKKRKHKVPVSIKQGGKRSNNIEVDHIVPIIDPVKGFESWDATIKNMFCEAHGLQVLCKDCHKRKTQDERSNRSTK